MDLAYPIRPSKGTIFFRLSAFVLIACKRLLDVVIGGQQKVAYAIQADSEHDTDEIMLILRIFAWESRIEGCHDAETGRLIISFDEGEPLSNEALATLVKKLGQHTRRIPYAKAFARGEYIGIQLCPDEQE